MPHDTIYMWNLIYGTNELIYKTEIESHRKQNYSYQKERVGGISKKFGISRYTLIYTHTHTHTYIYKTTRFYCVAQGAIFYIL